MTITKQEALNAVNVLAGVPGINAESIAALTSAVEEAFNATIEMINIVIENGDLKLAKTIYATLTANNSLSQAEAKYFAEAIEREESKEEDVEEPEEDPISKFIREKKKSFAERFKENSVDSERQQEPFYPTRPLTTPDSQPVRYCSPNAPYMYKTAKAESNREENVKKSMFETIEALTRSFREAHGLQLGTHTLDGRKVLVLKLDK